jgi:hypothetical protein
MEPVRNIDGTPYAKALCLAGGVAVFLFLCASLGGCAMAQWRVFQTKVDPKLAQTPPEAVEAQREGAAFIKQKSATLESNPQHQMQQIHAVATGLSASLGEPKRAVTAADYERTIAELRAGQLAAQERADKWRAFATKYAGKPLEDTGINLAGPAGLLGLVAIAAACVAFPGFGYLLLRVVPLLWGFFTRTSAAIDEFAAGHKDAGDALKIHLSRRMDEAHKALVRRRKPATA